jgi:hypothetical protein
MKIFYDTEFLEDGYSIDLISIGMVDEVGRELYLINDDMDYDRISKDEWLMKNVIAKLGHGEKVPKAEIRDRVQHFLGRYVPHIELWAWYGAYDHVAYAQLFGKMIDLPQGFPMFTHDLKQVDSMHGPFSYPYQAAGIHNALEDAKHLKVKYDSLVERGVIK